MRKGILIAIAAFAADRVTKAAALRLTAPKTGRLFALRLTRNTGVAFSMLSDSGALLIALTLALMAALIVWIIRDRTAPAPALWLILGGAAGNLFDRVAYGYVVDFIEPLFIRFAIFNVADICVVGGACLAIILMYLNEKRGK